MRITSFEILRFPLITEKSTILSEQRKYIFAVDPSSTKQTVTKAIEDVFSVKVTKVNILNMKGKTKRFKGRMGKRSDIKKAIVTLAQDNTIDFTGGVK